MLGGSRPPALVWGLCGHRLHVLASGRHLREFCSDFENGKALALTRKEDLERNVTSRPGHCRGLAACGRRRAGSPLGQGVGCRPHARRSRGSDQAPHPSRCLFGSALCGFAGWVPPRSPGPLPRPDSSRLECPVESCLCVGARAVQPQVWLWDGGSARGTAVRFAETLSLEPLKLTTEPRACFMPTLALGGGARGGLPAGRGPSGRLRPPPPAPTPQSLLTVEL